MARTICAGGSSCSLSPPVSRGPHSNSASSSSSLFGSATMISDHLQTSSPLGPTRGSVSMDSSTSMSGGTKVVRVDPSTLASPALESVTVLKPGSNPSTVTPEKDDLDEEYVGSV